MTRCLIFVFLKKISIELRWGVVEGTGSGRRVVGGRGGFEDLVAGFGFLEFLIEKVVFGTEAVGLAFEGGELGFEVFDMPLFALAEGSLAVCGSC
jgi:hypothetical protein